MAEDRDIDSFELATKVDSVDSAPSLDSDGNGLYVEDEDLVFGKRLQRALADKGFPVMGVGPDPREDGVVDRATLFQVQRFKKSLGMKPTTTLTKAIKSRLGL